MQNSLPLRWWQTMLRIACTFIILVISSCTVFQARYHQWNQQVTRNAEGIMQVATPYTTGEGEDALLLIHGFGDGPQVWKSLAPQLAAHGYTVRCMRLKGWGEPVEIKQHVYWEQWMEQIAEEVNELKKEHIRVGILAHSLGGGVLRAMLDRQVMTPDGVILYAPMLGISNARSPLLSSRIWFRIGSMLLPEHMILESVFGDHSARGQKRPRTERDPFVPVHLHKEIFRLLDTLEQPADVILCPLRVVLPETDRVVDSSRTLNWLQNVEAPEIVVDIRPETGHVLPLDMTAEAEAEQIHIWFSHLEAHP